MSELYVPGQLEVLSTTEPALWEGMCLIEGLRRLGVEDGEDLYTVRPLVDRVTARSAPRCLLPERTSAGDVSLFVRVQTELLGDVWTGTVGALDWPMSELDARWAAALRVWNRTPDAEKEPLWQASRARQRLSDLETLLRQHRLLPDRVRERA